MSVLWYFCGDLNVYSDDEICCCISENKADHVPAVKMCKGMMGNHTIKPVDHVV